MILHIYNKVWEYNDFVKNNGWINTTKFSPFTMMHELCGKTIGIVGYGSIGKQVGKIAKAFGMNVLAYKRSKTDEPELTTLNNLLENSDIVTMHCPLNKDSEKMCNKDASC